MTKVSDLFDIRYGNGLELNRMTMAAPANGIAFVSRQRKNNGVAAYVRELAGEALNPAGELTCALNGEGGVMSAFLQERPYYTAFHVACLQPKTELTRGQKLYYCECLWANHFRYSWGRMANRTLKDTVIPSLQEIPEWVDLVATSPFSGQDKPADSSPTPKLDARRWRAFQLSELFEIKKGKRLTKQKMRSGSTPFLGSIDGNNGLVCKISNAPLHSGNTLTVNYNGSVGECFYQPEPFWCSDDVNVLYPKFQLTPAIGLFVSTIIRQEKYRYNFGRKWHLDRMEQSEIRLPADGNKKPDWEYMEQYVKTLPFSSQI